MLIFIHRFFPLLHSLSSFIPAVSTLQGSLPAISFRELSTQQPTVEPKLTHLNITAQTLACFSWPYASTYRGLTRASLPGDPSLSVVTVYLYKVVDFSHLAHAGCVILSPTVKSTKIGTFLEQAQLVPSSSASKTVAELLSSEEAPPAKLR